MHFITIDEGGEELSGEAQQYIKDRTKIAYTEKIRRCTYDREKLCMCLKSHVRKECFLCYAYQEGVRPTKDYEPLPPEDALLLYDRLQSYVEEAK